MDENREQIIEVPFDVTALVVQAWEVHSPVKTRNDPALALEAAYTLCANYDVICFNIYNSVTIFTFHRDPSLLASFEATVADGLKERGIELKKTTNEAASESENVSEISTSTMNRALQYFLMVGLAKRGWKRIESNNFIKKVRGTEYDSVTFEVFYANSSVNLRLLSSSITLHVLEPKDILVDENDFMVFYEGSPIGNSRLLDVPIKALPKLSKAGLKKIQKKYPINDAFSSSESMKNYWKFMVLEYGYEIDVNKGFAIVTFGFQQPLTYPLECLIRDDIAVNASRSRQRSSEIGRAFLEDLGGLRWQGEPWVKIPARPQPITLSLDFVLAVSIPPTAGEKISHKSVPVSQKRPPKDVSTSPRTLTGDPSLPLERGKNRVSLPTPKAPRSPPKQTLSPPKPTPVAVQKPPAPLLPHKPQSSEKVQLPSFKRSAANLGESQRDPTPTPKPTSLTSTKRPLETLPKDPSSQNISTKEVGPPLKKQKLDKPAESANAPSTFKEISSIDGINFRELHLKGTLDTLSLLDMKSFLKKQGLATSGKKPDLLKRIQSHFLGEEE